MNHIVLMGNLTQNPKITISKTNKKIADICIGISRPWASNKNDADFIWCKAFDKIADVLEKYFVKGQKILVSGRMQTKRYEDKNGESKVNTQVIINQVEFCDSKNNGHSKYAANDAKTNIEYTMVPPNNIEDTMAPPNNEDDIFDTLFCEV